MTTLLYRPATMSSATMPHPPGRASSCRAGGGLTISRARKTKKPAITVPVLGDKNATAKRKPTPSSMTTCLGSLPHSRAALPALYTPMAEAAKSTPIHSSTPKAGTNSQYNRATNAVPAVPDAHGAWPTKKSVAISRFRRNAFLYAALRVPYRKRSRGTGSENPTAASATAPPPTVHWPKAGLAGRRERRDDPWQNAPSPPQGQ